MRGEGARTDAEYVEAISKLQKFLKRRKVQRTWAKAIEDLREQYLDPRALEAGAADSKWYSNTALAARTSAGVDLAGGCSMQTKCLAYDSTPVAVPVAHPA
jgi:hypothetical protein